MVRVELGSSRGGRARRARACARARASRRLAAAACVMNRRAFFRGVAAACLGAAARVYAPSSERFVGRAVDIEVHDEGAFLASVGDDVVWVDVEAAWRRIPPKMLPMPRPWFSLEHHA